MEIAYVTQYQNPCEVAYIQTCAQNCEQFEYACYSPLECSEQTDSAQSADAREQYATSSSDVPTPLPLFPDDDKKQSVMPFFGGFGIPSLLEESDFDEILGRVYEKDYITAARGFKVDGNIVIAALTEPFFLKSERDSAIVSLQTELNDMSQDAFVTVCFDLDIYRRIDENMSQEAMRELLAIAKERNDRRRPSLDAQ